MRIYSMESLLAYNSIVPLDEQMNMRYKTQAIQNQTTFSTLSLVGGCMFICVYVNQETSARAHNRE